MGENAHDDAPQVKTSDHRKAIPLKVKLLVLINQARCSACGKKLGDANQLQFDHRPPLLLREWCEEKQDWNPAQNDPLYLEAIHEDCHQARTTGRKGTSIATTRGSDVGDFAHISAAAEKHEAFRRRLLAKEPGTSARPPSRWPKRKIR